MSEDYQIEQIEILEPVGGWDELQQVGGELRDSIRTYSWSSALAALTFILWAVAVGLWTDQWAPLSLLLALVLGGRLALWYGYWQSGQIVNGVMLTGRFAPDSSTQFARILRYSILASFLWLWTLPVGLWLFIAVAVNSALWKAWIVLASGLVLMIGTRSLLRRYRMQLRRIDRTLFGPRG